MEDKKVTNPSIPLTNEELRAIGAIRSSKQRSKRTILTLIPTFVLLVVGLAIHRQGFDVGTLLVIMAMAGCIAGLVVVGSWSNKIVRQFAREHQGAFWRKESSENK